MKKILVTGATGYVGRRLEERLLDRSDLSVRVLVRNRNKVRASVLGRVEIVEGDTFDPAVLARALEGVHTAFYLIHSMGAGKRFEDRDRQSAANFRDACIEAGVKRVVYLGGLGRRDTASRHLRSRLETGEILSATPGRLQVLWFRAAVIIGAGSASFEIIRNLVQKLPAMVTPIWVSTRTQPIAIDDVLSYLQAAIDYSGDDSQVIDIGGEVTTFGDMLVEAGRVMGLRRFLLPVPVLSTRFSSYWLILFTPVPFRMAASLVEGLRSETVAQNESARSVFPGIVPMAYPEAVRRAVAEIENDGVVSRWCDSSAGVACDIKDLDAPVGAILRDVRRVPLAGVAPGHVFASVCAIGGGAGWFRYHFLWRVRGLIDKLVGGSGLNRGRRASHALRVGDAIDFWKVADIRENKRLLLLAQMKLPGRAWLEFDIHPDELVQTAHFAPRGLLGRLYWYAVLPLHHLVFADLARRLVERAADFAGQRQNKGQH